ncbi:MAG TPA: ABC transporter permease [Candidatus Polarisedimenticolaceae bacterium]|nr:ABC transporter permease [Candidatus Polarisedimenticolaceae bacterium]
MTGHLLRLVWHRKRSNALVVVEIFCSFLVLSAVTTLGTFLLDNYLSPIGYAWKDVWDVRIGSGTREEGEAQGQGPATFQRLLQEARGFDEVVAAAGSFSVPYDTSTSISSYDHPPVTTEINWATDELAEVLGLELERGRWFEPADTARQWQPVVLDADLARQLFGDADPLGQVPPTDIDAQTPTRVVGVLREFRKSGELAAKGNYRFERVRLDRPGEDLPRNLLLKLRPGTGAAFEPRLLERLQRVAPDWSFEIRPLEQMRRTQLRLRLAPLLVGCVVAGFLLLMVALGLIGVLWQNVTQRTREFGLRRATGAAGRDVRRQVLIELLLMTALGLVLGTLVVAQVPLLHWFDGVGPKIWIGGVLGSALGMLLLAAACGLYPSWLATRIRPAEALHYD